MAREPATPILADLRDLADDPLAVLRRLIELAHDHDAIAIVGIVEGAEWAPIRRLLIALAEIDRAHRREQIRRGLAALSQRGRRLLVDPGDVARLRAEGRSWSQIAQLTSCSVRTARRAFARVPAPAETATGERVP